MALVSTDGFDMYNGVAALTLTAPSHQARWVQTGAVTSLSLVTGRFGGQALRYAGQGVGLSTSWASRSFSAARNSGANGFAWRCSAVGNVGVVAASGGSIVFADAGNSQFGLFFNSAGGVAVTRPAAINTQGPTVLGTSAGGLFLSNVWYFIEVEWLISATVGTVTVKVNGVAVLTLTGLNNKAFAGSANCSQFIFVQPLQAGAGAGAHNQDIDDYYEADTAAAIGVGTISTLRTASDSAVAFTPSSGANNYSRVNEALADGDTTYNSGSVVGDRDLFGMDNLGSAPATIYGVQQVDFARETDAAVRTIYQQLKSGGTTDDGAARTLTASYTRHERMSVVDPNTAAAWAAAAVDALEKGYKIAS